MCDSVLGTDLHGASCRNAWEKIERSKKKVVFRDRKDILTPDIPLPVRFLSDDGFCSIDVDFLGDEDPHESDWETVSEVAGEILVKCVYSTAIGGWKDVPGK